MKDPKKLWKCKVHRCNENPRCFSCIIAIDYNVAREYCECGEPATGYRAMSAEAPVEYFCDEHFQGVPEPVSINP